MAYASPLPPAFAALADPTRRAVLERLRKGSKTVGELAAGLPVSRPAVSQQLKVLRAAALVTVRQVGTRHYFSINPATVLDLRAYLDEMWHDAMGAYAKHVADAECQRGRTR